MIKLREIIISFYDLIYIIYQWQRNYSVWLDLRHWITLKKLLKMNKTFKIKIKMDPTLNKHFKLSGIDPNPMQQPAPLKSLNIILMLLLYYSSSFVIPLFLYHFYNRCCFKNVLNQVQYEQEMFQWFMHTEWIYKIRERQFTKHYFLLLF